MTMHSLLEQDCAVAVDLDLDIVPDEASIDLAAALIAEAGRIGPPSPSEQAETPCRAAPNRRSSQQWLDHSTS